MSSKRYTEEFKIEGKHMKKYQRMALTISLAVLL